MRSIRHRLLVLLFIGVAAISGIGAVIQSSTDTNTAHVNSKSALEVVDGKSDRPTYIASASGLATTAAYSLSIESAAGTGFKLVQWCVGTSNATAAAAVTVTVQRRTTASAAGTLCTAEGTTANCAVSRFDPADGAFSGVARATATLGTAGAILDQLGFTVGEIGAGAADPNSQPIFCKNYGGATGEKPVVVSAGTANGLSINVSAPGAGGLASGSISATVIVE